MWGPSRLGFWFVADPVIITWNLEQDNILPECGPGGWYTASQGKQIRFIVQNSENPGCGGCNPSIQSGVATATFLTGSVSYYFSYSLTGDGEAQDTGYENMSLYLNGGVYSNQLLVSATSPGGGKGCAPGEPVIQTLVTPPPLLLSPSSSYTFRLEFTTQDSLYHTDCFYECSINFTRIP